MIKVIFKRNVTRIATAFALVAMTALSSCEHKDLCFDHDSHSPKYKFRVEATYHLTSSSCHPKIFVKEFSYFLMSCH